MLILPFQTRLILRPAEVEYLSISLYALDLFLILLLALFLLYFFRYPKRQLRLAKHKPLLFFLAGLDLFLFISIFFAPDKALALYHYILFLEGVGVFFLFSEADYSRLKLFISLSLSLILQAAIAAYQFFFQGSSACKWLGMSARVPAEPGISVIETLGPSGLGERWLRAYGAFDHPNILGAFLAIGILFIIYPLVKKRLKPKTFALNVCLVAYCVAVFGLILSFSRAAWLAVASGALLLFAYFVLKKNWFGQLKMLSLALMASFIFIVPFMSYNELFATRLSARGRLEEKSLDERGRYLREGKEIISKHIFFGAGIGNFARRQQELRPGDPFWTFQPVHNTFLLIWAEAGVFALLFFLCFIVWTAAESLAVGKVFNLSILLSLVIMMMLDHFWWSLHFGIIFFWLIMALLLRNIKYKNYERQ